MPEPFDLTILTGFLGAGKTTILNRFLATPEAAGTAVLVNEFGEVDVDGEVIGATMGAGNRLMSLPNGCICCEVQEDLAEALIGLADMAVGSGGPKRGVLETTGLADPGAILRGVAHDPRLKQRIRIAGTICVAPANTISDQLTRFDEAVHQVALADRLVISKTDLVPEAEAVRAALAKINPLAEIVTRAENDPVVGIFAPLERRDHALPAHHQHHSHSVASFTVSLPGPLNPDLFRDTMSFLIMRHAERLLRIKGIAHYAGENHWRLLNGVHDVFRSEPIHSRQRTTGVIVFIGIDLPESDIRADLERCIEKCAH